MCLACRRQQGRLADELNEGLGLLAAGGGQTDEDFPSVRAVSPFGVPILTFFSFSAWVMETVEPVSKGFVL